MGIPEMVQLVKMLEYLQEDGKLFDFHFPDGKTLSVEISGNDGIKTFDFYV